ncbi:E3 ubiquitin-protein ligase BRE1A-like [Chrysemys picta bellii]|uniref:E3 ubiquitin-protein ligase BRE1A-like n=1 Tax=Chrysemys picta bellii TaxID=8478 RepID=UPI0032B27867
MDSFTTPVTLVPDGTVAEFPIRSVSREDGGSYTCDYHSITDQSCWSYPSDPIEIIVAEQGYITSPRRSSPASRGSSRRRSASVERNWLEWEKELKLRELEDREQQRQHEERQRQHEREEKERQHQHEREENERQHQRELELARLKGSEPPAAVSDGGPRTARSFDKCIMAPYKEGEDMDDFLEAFETACELHRVDPADRLRVLTPLLDPKSVAFYRQLGEAEKGDYERFKKALLREFGLTPEMYRERFRSQDKTPEISYLQLAVRMERYASKWAGGAQTKEDLIKLMVQPSYPKPNISLRPSGRVALGEP